MLLGKLRSANVTILAPGTALCEAEPVPGRGQFYGGMIIPSGITMRNTAEGWF